jgi:hypothetical protein
MTLVGDQRPRRQRMFHQRQLAAAQPTPAVAHQAGITAYAGVAELHDD